LEGRLGFLVPKGGGVVLLVRGVMAGALVTPGEGEVDALDRDKEFLEEVEDGELEFCQCMGEGTLTNHWSSTGSLID